MLPSSTTGQAALLALQPSCPRRSCFVRLACDRRIPQPAAPRSIQQRVKLGAGRLPRCSGGCDSGTLCLLIQHSSRSGRSSGAALPVLPLAAAIALCGSGGSLLRCALCGTPQASLGARMQL